MIEIRSPLPQFFDTSGDALDDGEIYIGIAGANPETHAQNLYWDKAGTIVANQPISTLNGYPSRDGAVSKFYTATKNYSITVRNKRGELVYSVLNSDSGVFDELTDVSSAAGIGYSNTTSGLTADDVQAAIDELKTDADALAATVTGVSTGSAGAMNLFANSAFFHNQRGYSSGVATTTPNQYTVDRVRVVVSGENLIITASTFGNRITAPAGGAEQVIEGNRITGGDYACTWTGSGTMQVNGVLRAKGETFTLSAGGNVTIRMSGDFERVLFTRPNQLGQYEYDFARDLQLCQRYFYAGSTYWTGQATSSARAGAQVVFPVTMRATPTVSNWANLVANGFPTTDPTAFGITTSGFTADRVASSTTTDGRWSASFQASAEL